MNKKITQMSNYEIARWCALLKAIDIVDENCEILNKSFDDVELKPIALKHYINSLSNKIENDFEQLEKKKNDYIKTEKTIINNIISSTQNYDVLQDNIS